MARTNCFQPNFSYSVFRGVRSCGVIVESEIGSVSDEEVMGGFIVGARTGGRVRLMVSGREMGFWSAC